MKLIRKTYYLSFAWIIPVFIIGSVFSFYMIKFIIYDETDEFLTYEKDRLLRYHKEHNTLPEYIRLGGIFYNLKMEIPIFKDTMLLESADNEFVPYRELWFSINHKGEDVTLVLRHLMPGNDDILEGAILIIGGFILLIICLMLIVISQISGKLWKPFYITLSLMERYKTGSSLPNFPRSTIEEFSALNQTIESLLQKIIDDFKRTKEFNENVSHELQTGLAIIRSNAEELLSKEQNEDVKLYLRSIFNATIKLTRIQKSLLLLSKIANTEYRNNKVLNFADTYKEVSSIYNEAIQIREISLSETILPCYVNIDEGLADILINNLIKNAVKHNVQKGIINVVIKPEYILIENSGNGFIGNPEKLIKRYETGHNGNFGLGLSIVKQICVLFGFDITYKISDKNIHSIKILLNNN
jgi:signal transduction histidine kinase